MNTDYKEQIERALASAAPINDLRALATELSSSGLRRSEIYRIFYAYYKILQASGRQREEDVLGDVMDMVTDTYAGNNMNLPR